MGMDALDDRIVNLISAVIGGGLFALLNGIFSLVANRRKTGSEAKKIDAEAGKTTAEMAASYQDQIITLLQQGKIDYTEREKERDERRLSDDKLYESIRRLESEKRLLENSAKEKDVLLREATSVRIQLIAERDKARADGLTYLEKIGSLEGIVEKQGSTLITMNSQLLDIKKDTGKLISNQ